MTGPAIPRRLLSTIGVMLCRRGLGQLAAHDPPPPANRHERERAGELIHIDIKKLGRIDGIGHRITGDRTGQSNRLTVGRGLGWEWVHVAIADAARLAHTDLLPDERKQSAITFTARAINWFARHGVKKVERIMSDNGSAYKSLVFRDLLTKRGIKHKHKRTRPYTPSTNGKAERFIQTSPREWAYVHPFQTSADPEAALLPWITAYNSAWPHSALHGKPPLTWLAAAGAQNLTTPAATSDLKPGFVGVAAVTPREATAKGGSGLTPDTPTQAKSAIGLDNLLGNDTAARARHAPIQGLPARRIGA